MVNYVHDCSNCASCCVRVQSPALFFPFLDCFAHVIVVPNQYASPLFQFVHLVRLGCGRSGYLTFECAQKTFRETTVSKIAKNGAFGFGLR
jgi:hypothetical protein